MDILSSFRQVPEIHYGTHIPANRRRLSAKRFWPFPDDFKRKKEARGHGSPGGSALASAPGDFAGTSEGSPPVAASVTAPPPSVSGAGDDSISFESSSGV
jgi:hypothetical protein